jgi:hypothetical protein
MLRVIQIAKIPSTKAGYIQFHASLRALITLHFQVASQANDEMPLDFQEAAHRTKQIEQN